MRINCTIKILTNTDNMYLQFLHIDINFIKLHNFNLPF